MKRPAEQLHLRVSDHVAFFSYRWVAWVLAALALTLPGRSPEALPRDAGLLLLLGVINVLATALSRGYVRLLRQRPPLLLLDLVACAAVLWLSGSQPLPFLPYALSALVLPALIFGWRGALVSALMFIGLDVLGLTAINSAAGAALTMPALVFRVATPLAFAFAWAVLGRVLARDVGAGSRSGRWVAEPVSGVTARAASSTQRSATPLSLAELKQAATSGDTRVNLASTTPMIATRTAAEQRPAPVRRVIYDLPLTPEITLQTALERLGSAVARQSGLDVRVTCSGTVRPLHAAQQTVLLRAAQEALENVQQHARAQTALVGLCFAPPTVTLTVQDDGVGLLDGTYERPGLHALRVVRYRLAEFDGQLIVVEGEAGGVTVRATLPLDGA